MNTLDHVDLLPPLILGVVNVLFAGLLHRAIVNDSILLRRRQFYESLALLAFLAAFVLLVTGFLMWRQNPRFVIVCDAIWISGCIVALLALRRRDGRGSEELVMPEAWPDLPERSPRSSPRSAPPRREAGTPAPSGPLGPATPEGAVGTRVGARPGVRAPARLKLVRRERSAGSADDRLESDRRFRLNRSVYEHEDLASGGRRPDED